MYNLFVSGDANDWEGEPFLTEIERCVREYTDTDITRRYENLNATSIGVLQRLPCIFAYESRCKKLPKFGVIRSVTKRERQGRVSVDYQIKEIGSFLTLENLAALAFDLDIDKYEMNRTHWAVKNVNLARELKSVGIVLPGWARTLSKAVNIATHRFDVALSFPGEARSLIEPIVVELERNLGPNSYFYDANYASQLARPSLDTLLQDIYGKRSKFVVVFPIR